MFTIQSPIKIVLLLVFTTFLSTSLSASGIRVFVDNRDSSVIRSGYWAISGGTSPFLTDSEYAVGSSTFTWQANLPEAGKYEVQAYWTPWANRTTQANYEIYHDGGVDSVLMNQRQNAGQWVTLDQYDFSAGTNQVVVNNAGSGTLNADAIRFIEILSSTLTTDVDYTLNIDQSLNRARLYTTPRELFLMYGDIIFIKNERLLYGTIPAARPFFGGRGDRNDLWYSVEDYAPIETISNANIRALGSGHLLVSWLISKADGFTDLYGTREYRLETRLINTNTDTMISHRYNIHPLVYQAIIDQVTFKNDGSSTIQVDLGDAGDLTIDFDALLIPTAIIDPYSQL